MLLNGSERVGAFDLDPRMIAGHGGCLMHIESHILLVVHFISAVRRPATP